MNSIKQLHHAMTINRTLVKYGLDEFLAPTPLAKLRSVIRILSFNHGKKYLHLSRGERLVLALTELGPIYIKLGQMLSTRRDLIPEDIANELAKLQDQVAPFSSDIAQEVIEQQLGSTLENTFKSFESKPLASASIAQVHGAELLDGECVVIKILRPGIHQQVAKDLDMLHSLAHWAESYSDDAKRLRIKQVIKDYDTTIHNELDFRIEAANTSHLKHNFEESELLYVPTVHWDYCRERIMVVERISGIPIGDVQALKDSGIDMKQLADRGVEIFFTQVFRDSFFHADMHPGNIFVDVTDKQNPQYIGIDCGIMGTLNETDKHYLAHNFMAFFERDYRRIAELHVKSGWIDSDVSVGDFESAIRAACEPIFGKKISEISFGHFLIQLFQTARRFNMQVQPQLVLLQKTLLYIEGLGRQLYPELDLWETAQPYLKQWLKEQLSVQSVFNSFKKQAPDLMRHLPSLPARLLGTLEQASNFEQSFEQLKKDYQALQVHKLQQTYARKHAIIGIGLGVIGGIMLVGLPEMIWPSLACGCGSLYFLVKSLWPSRPKTQ